MLNRELDNNTTLFDKVALWCFQDRNTTTIEINMPLGFLVQIDLDILVSNFLKSECVTGSCGEGAQVMIVQAEVVLIDLLLDLVVGGRDDLFE